MTPRERVARIAAMFRWRQANPNYATVARRERGLQAGRHGATASPMPNSRRTANYLKQTGRATLTAAQARRVRKHERRWGSS